MLIAKFSGKNKDFAGYLRLMRRFEELGLDEVTVCYTVIGENGAMTMKRRVASVCKQAC